MKKIISLILLSYLVTTGYAKDEIRYGWSPSFVALSIDDPDGNTNSSSELQLLGGTVIYPLSRSTRTLVSLSLYDFELDAGVNKIGQGVESLSIAGSYQWKFKMSRKFKPWLGVGLNINMDELTNRHTIDQDGYLAQTYTDREETSIGINLGASHEWDISDGILMGLNIEYLIPLGESLEGFKIGMSLYY